MTRTDFNFALRAIERRLLENGHLMSKRTFDVKTDN